MVIPADADALLRGQAVVNDAVAVIVPGIIVQRCLEGAGGLVKGLIANGVHFDLQAGAVGRLAERGHLFIGIIQHAAAALSVDVRGVHGGVVGAEAAVQRALKAAADAGQRAPGGCFYVQRLGENPQLEAVAQRFGKQLFKGDIQVGNEAHAADGMHHADAAAGLEVHRRLHIAEQLDQRQRACDIIRKLEEGLLVHFAGVGMIAAQPAHFGVQFMEQFAVDNAGVAVVLDHHDLLIGADSVQLFPADQAALPDRIGRGAEGDQRFFAA